MMLLSTDYEGKGLGRVLVVETTENRPRKNPADGMNYT